MRPGDKASGLAAALERPRAVSYWDAAKALQAGASSRVTTGPTGMPSPAQAFHEPGGATLHRMLHPEFNILEKQYRVLPDQGWFDPSIGPSNPVQFELGSFQVPKNQMFWLFDYEFTVFRQSGIDPGDFFAAEPGRFSGSLGFDLQMGSNKRVSNLFYELDPVPIPVQRLSFAQTSTRQPQAAFDSAQSNSFAAAASPGSSLLPVTNQVQGPRNASFTLIAEQNDIISLQCVIFKTVMAPVATIQGKFSGYLVNQQVSEALLARLRPY
jgi:hypothetical protein